MTRTNAAAIAVLLLASLASPCLGLAAESSSASPGELYVAFGDSLTEYRGGSSYIVQLGRLRPGSTVINAGIGGQRTPQIVARQGGAPALITIVGNVLPARGGALVASISVPVLTTASYHLETSLDGSLCGVQGALTKSVDDRYSFVRRNDGLPTRCPNASPFLPALGQRAIKATWIIWTGRNDPSASYAPMTQAGIAAAVAFDKRPEKQFLVLGVTPLSDGSEDRGTTQYGRIISLNAALARSYGQVGFGGAGNLTAQGHFLDVRRYLVEFGLTAAGISPTDVDRRDMSADVIPSSLLGSDKKHLNPAGHRVLAQAINAVLNAGW